MTEKYNVRLAGKIVVIRLVEYALPVHK